MAADITVLDKRFTFEITLGSGLTVKPGDGLAYNGSSWVKADADTPSLYAQVFATQYGGTLQGPIEVARELIIQDGDAPYTAGDTLYLSGTAGAHTATRPTTAGQLRQVVGQVLTTSIAHLKGGVLREVNVPLVTTGATSAYAVLDSGNFGGPTLDAQNETLSMFAVVPENAVSLKIAKLFLAAEATAGTPTMDVTVSSAVDGEQWDAVTADATGANAVREGAAADEMQVTDVTTWFDATNIIRNGAALGVKCLQDDAGTDISFVFGGVLTFLVV